MFHEYEGKKGRKEMKWNEKAEFRQSQSLAAANYANLGSALGGVCQCTLYLLACQVGVTVGDSLVICVTSVERCQFLLFIDSAPGLKKKKEKKKEKKQTTKQKTNKLLLLLILPQA